MHLVPRRHTVHPRERDPGDLTLGELPGLPVRLHPDIRASPPLVLSRAPDQRCLPLVRKLDRLPEQTGGQNLASLSKEQRRQIAAHLRAGRMRDVRRTTIRDRDHLKTSVQAMIPLRDHSLQIRMTHPGSRNPVSRGNRNPDSWVRMRPRRQRTEFSGSGSDSREATRSDLPQELLFSGRLAEWCGVQISGMLWDRERRQLVGIRGKALQNHPGIPPGIQRVYPPKQRPGLNRGSLNRRPGPGRNGRMSQMRYRNAVPAFPLPLLPLPFPGQPFFSSSPCSDSGESGRRTCSIMTAEELCSMQSLMHLASMLFPCPGGWR